MKNLLVTRQKKKITKREKVGVQGIYTLTKCDTSSPLAQKMAQEIEAFVNEWRGRLTTVELRDWHYKEYQKLVEVFHGKFMIWQSKVPAHNLVVNNGLEMLARIISGDVTYTGVINYCTLGDGNTAVSATDTTLDNEVYRKLISSSTFSAGEAFISTFFNQTEIVDTIEEIGHVIDGSAGADTGQQYSRIEAADTVELPVTKSITETLTVDYKSTFANA